jgi:hypothetical protein
MTNILGTGEMERNSKLQSLKNVVTKWLKLVDDTIIEIVCVAYVALKLEGDPLWIMIVGPPSSAKTETIMGLADCSEVRVISALTPQTFISGQRGKDKSLIHKVNDKLVVHKDFGTILSMRSEPRQEILSQLREIYDGRLSKSFGTGKTVDWEGRMGFLGGCTPVIDQHYGVNQQLGERFVYYRVDGGNPIETGMQALKIVGKENKMRSEIRQAFKQFLESIQPQDGKIPIPDSIKGRIIHLAAFAATARTGVPRNYKTQEIEAVPTPEGSPRITKQLATIGIALAIIHEKQEFDEGIFKTLRKIGRDTIPGTRLKVIDTLWDCEIISKHDALEKTNKIAELVNYPTTTTRLILEDLNSLYLVDRRAGSPDRWGLSNQCCEWIRTYEGIEPPEKEPEQLTLNTQNKVDPQACRDCENYHKGFCIYYGEDEKIKVEYMRSCPND